jgi:twitching motility protein PilI
MNSEYFSVKLSNSIQLGLPLTDMATVTQLEHKNICLVPGVAPFWYGVVNFQGSLLWVLDSDRFFALDTSGDRVSPKLTVVILKHQIEATQRQIALTVKQLQGIITVNSSKLNPVPSSLSAYLQSACEASIQESNTNQVTCILNTSAFLQQLYQQSMLVAV